MGRVIKKAKHQTGKSDPVRDALYRALPPGKRVSRTGKIYYEYRRNRSDLTPDEKPKKRKKKTQKKKPRKKKKTTRKTITLELKLGESRSAKYRSLHWRSLWFVYDKRSKDWKPKRAEKVKWEKASRSKRYGTGLFRFREGQIVKNVTEEGTDYYIVTKDGLKELRVEKKVEKIDTPLGKKALKLTKTLYLGNRPVGKEEAYKIEDSRVYSRYLKYWFSPKEFKKIIKEYRKKK